VGVRPISGDALRLVDLFRPVLVVDRQPLSRLACQRLQNEDGVGAEAVDREQLEVAGEVAGVQPRQRKPVAVSGERNARLAAVHLGGGGVVGGAGDDGVGRRRVEVAEDLADEPHGDAAAEVAHLDGDVLGALDDEHLDGRVADGVLAVVLDGGAHRVLEELEEDVVEMRRHVDALDAVVARCPFLC